MTAKFCANFGFMFTEEPSILKRYALASSVGFKGVESPFPSEGTLQDVLNAKQSAGVQQVLLNMYADPGTFGCAAVVGEENKFKTNLLKTIDYAKALKCRKIHITAGVVNNPNDKNHEVYESNLKIAAKLLEQEKIVGTIEPINQYSLPNYYLNDYDRAIGLIEKINSPSIKLQLDIFHLQHIRGDLTNQIKRLIPYTGHVQIAQNPNRGEPNTRGEIDYHYILKIILANYSDWIGLEYKPEHSTFDGLVWIEQFGYRL